MSQETQDKFRHISLAAKLACWRAAQRGAARPGLVPIASLPWLAWAEVEAQRRREARSTRKTLSAIIAAAAEARAALGPAVRVSAEEQARREAQAQADARAKRKAALLARGVPAGAAAVIAADELQATAAVDQAKAWMRERLQERRAGQLGGKRVLVLAGKKDASKTTAASVIVERWPLWQRLEECPLLVSFEQILGPWYHRPSEAQPRDELTGLTRRQLLTASLLVLDDVGQESAELAERHGEVLDQLLKARCDSDRYTIITTNYEKGEDLLRRYGPRAGRIGERITEFGVWADCPREGLRSARRRAMELNRRRESAICEGT